MAPTHMHFPSKLKVLKQCAEEEAVAKIQALLQALLGKK